MTMFLYKANLTDPALRSGGRGGKYLGGNSSQKQGECCAYNAAPVGLFKWSGGTQTQALSLTNSPDSIFVWPTSHDRIRCTNLRQRHRQRNQRQRSEMREKLRFRDKLLMAPRAHGRFTLGSLRPGSQGVRHDLRQRRDQQALSV